MERTLQSHRFALSLNPANTDILFNTAQVLTSLAEAQLEAGTTASGKYEARPLLEEAVQLFTQCLESQQQEYAQTQAEIAKAQASGEYQEAWEGERQQPKDAQDDSMDIASSASEVPGDWATVEEPLTPESILETCIAQLGAVTTLLGLYDPNAHLSSMEKIARDGLETANNHIPALLDLVATTPAPSAPSQEPKSGPTLSIGSTAAAEEASTTPRDDAILAAANFQASLEEMTYRSGRNTSAAYAQAIERIFSALDTTINAPAPVPASTPPSAALAALNIHSAYADALIDLASALSDSLHHSTASPTTTAAATDVDIQWTALTQAQLSLAYMGTAPYVSLLSPARLADVFLARGDVELFRFRLSYAGAARPAWVKSRAVLVGNAGAYYRGARGYAERGSAGEIRSTADAKAVVAEVLKVGLEGGGGAVREEWRGRSEAVARVLEQMVQEGVVGREEAEGVLSAVQ